MKSPPRGVAVDVSSSVRRLSVSRPRVRSAALAVLASERIRHAMISITFVGRARISELNGRYLGHPGPTDVISFALERHRSRDPVIGDIYICVDVARANAKRQGVSAAEEVLRLVVHGTLHVLGYDHPEKGDRTASKMWKRQERILARIL